MEGLGSCLRNYIVPGPCIPGLMAGVCAHDRYNAEGYAPAELACGIAKDAEELRRQVA